MALYTEGMSEERSSIIPWLNKFIIISIALVVGFYLRNILVLGFIGLIIASAIRPAVKWGRKMYLPPALSILLSYTFIFVALSVLLSLVIPPLAHDSSLLLQRASAALGLENVNFVREISLDVTQLTEVAQNFDQYNGILTQLTGSVQVVLGLLASTFSLFFILFTLLMVAFHMLAGIERFSLSFAWMLPRKTRQEQSKLAIEIMDELTVQLGAWVRGQLLLMLIIGIGTYLGLLALGVPYAIPLALLAGLLEFVPNLGPTIAAVPTVLVAFILVNPAVGLLTLAFCVIVQQLENNFIVPGVMKNAVDVQPLTTIMLLLIGFEVMGVMGAVISVPLYVAVRCVARYIWPDVGPFAQYEEYLPAALRRKVKNQAKS